MRAAPAVTVTLPGSLRWHVVPALVGACASAAAVAACALHAQAAGRLGPETRVALAAVAALAGGAFAWRLRPLDRGRVRWDGAQWWFRSDGAPEPVERPGRLQVRIDLGGWMLLQFEAVADASTAGSMLPGARRPQAWLPVSPRRIAGSTTALRAALLAGRPVAAPEGGTP